MLSRLFHTTLVCKKLPEHEVPETVKVRRLRGGPFSWLRFLRLAKQHRTHHQIIHTSPELYGVLLGWLAKHCLGYLWVYDLWDHPSLEFSLGQKPRHWLKRFLYEHVLSRMLGQADLWIVAMHADVLRTLPPTGKSTEILHVTNGIDPGVLHLSSTEASDWPARNNCLRLTYSGWVLLQRGIGILLDFLACDEISSSSWDIRLDVRLLGKTDGATLEAIDTHNLVCRNQVEYLGFLSHERSLEEIRTSDICVCLLDPSVLNYTYAYPIKILEYLGHGCIVIASRTLGVAEIIEDGENGFLMNQYSSRELAQTMVRVKEAYAAGKIPAIRREARRTARRFDWQLINEEIATRLVALATRDPCGISR